MGTLSIDELKDSLERDIRQNRLRAAMWSAKAAAHRKTAEFHRLRADVWAADSAPDQAEIENDLTYARWEDETAIHCDRRAKEARELAAEQADDMHRVLTEYASSDNE